jgi:molecular chaperone HscB
MNYFAFYHLPISFEVDEVALKRLFFRYARQYHPDFHTMAIPEKQAEILELSTYNTQAYKTLSDFDSRLKYILELKGVLAEEGQNTLPQDFLVEMMDINEAIMELEFDFDEAIYNKAKREAEAIENQLFEEIKPILENYKDGETSLDDLELVKIFFLKKRYLFRVFENLSKFAPL